MRVAKAKPRVNKLLQASQQLPQKRTGSFLARLDAETRQDVLEVAQALADGSLLSSLSGVSQVLRAAGIHASKGQLQSLVAKLRAGDAT